MKRWTFKREAGWMVWIYIIPPLVAIGMALLKPMLRG